ncbi:NAD(P)H-hydrate epimerase [Ulvibacterium marinum]|uniref:NAD(P)H-hydrate epimerase n=1 Tax=Ulvibacterium marinum TaxID=2419782 RepID=A0A3B0BWP8_9FLAO|nr:NAD(P)H-hydrate epimerase [Ulvibacterium marinum]RKN76961.1 NAD(P)H-hydrate epimerase [Ulvibacterium marinum]
MKTEALSLKSFKEMDYLAVNKYNLPIELMMENAGLQLARLTTKKALKNDKIIIGIGNGNNGGGGLVAARRLAAWGYNVYLDVAVSITKELPKAQLKRALSFGVKEGLPTQKDIWIDAYLGFSQRSPLSQIFVEKINMANASGAHRISLDIPLGILSDGPHPMFMADEVLTLAAPKKILKVLSPETDIFVADIGIPEDIYKKFKITMPEFSKQPILKI